MSGTHLDRAIRGDITLEHAVEAAHGFADQSLSGNTRRSYASAWKGYVVWCGEHDFTPLGPPGQVAVWLAKRAEEGVKVSTLTVALSAIAKAYEMTNMPNPREDRAVKLVFSGIRRQLGTAPDQVEAILPDGLRLMVAAVPAPVGKHRLRSLRDRAMLVVGWAGGMRRSEVVGLMIEDIVWVPEGARLLIRRSKTDQEGRGREITLPYGSWLETCPIRNLKAWLEATELTSGPIFRPVSVDGKRVRDRPLSDRQLATTVKDLAAKAGLDGRFAGHSLRAGLVTSAVRAGKRVDAIQQQTGHKTIDMLMRYVRQQEAFANHPAAGLI